MPSTGRPDVLPEKATGNRVASPYTENIGMAWKNLSNKLVNKCRGETSSEHRAADQLQKGFLRARFIPQHPGLWLRD